MRLGDCIGILWFDVFRIRRQVALDNLLIAFPESTLVWREQTARQSLCCMGRTIIEYASFPFMTRERIEALIRVVGEDNLKNATTNSGALLLTLHLGNGDFASAAMSLMGWKMNLISKEFKSAWLNEMWFGMRMRSGLRFISPEKSSFEILRTLKRREIVIFVLDQFMGPPIGVRTQFFGRETGTAMGCALMADRTDAPVVPSYTYRNSDGTHTIVFEPPIPYLDVGPREQNIAAMTQIYTDKLEQIVRQRPEQWMWIHRRWKEFRD
jgi:KDO2-lipid IV(A) lauroyltransferase